MEPGALIFVTLVAFLGLGLLYFRFRDAVSSFSSSKTETAPPIPSSQPTVPQTVPIQADAPSQAKDATPAVASSVSSDDEAWTAEEILRQLALVKKLNKDGSIAYLSKEKMAALVGMRAEEARAIINEARGEPPPSPPADPKFPESTKDGRIVASHLRTGAKRA